MSRTITIDERLGARIRNSIYMTRTLIQKDFPQQYILNTLEMIENISSEETKKVRTHCPECNERLGHPLGDTINCPTCKWVGDTFIVVSKQREDDV